MKRMLSLLLLLLILCTACAPQAAPVTPNTYLVYYPVAQLETAAGADAVVAREVVIDGAEEMDTVQLSKELLRCLLGQAPDEAVTAPVKNGATLQSVSIAGQWAQVDFSRAYAYLTGIDLTLADYCVALTLTQLEGVNAVTITADGRTVPQRGERPLVAADALLGTMEQARRPITVSLYFHDAANDTLRAERRALDLYEGQTRADALLSALLQGPEDETLAELLPENFSVLSVHIDSGICYLNLADDTNFAQNAGLAIDSLVASLGSLDFIEQVQIVLDGETRRELNGVFIGEPLQPKVF